jgi:pimeloyl-ACP methyl ester carboxylesterase
VPSPEDLLPLPPALVHIPDTVEDASFDPAPPGVGRTAKSAPRRWWGRPVAELRWQAELARLLVDPVFLGTGVTRGGGAPVLLIPGFLAGDTSLSVMSSWLKRMDYVPRRSGIYSNVDCSNRTLERLDERLWRIFEETGRRVTIIGHSRGGHFAKALAHRRPERVAGVISMGAGLDTPFDISLPTRYAVAAFREIYAATTDRVARNGCFTEHCGCNFTRDYAGAFPGEVPLTSIYSRGDGVVWWEACVVPYASNVEVTGSHIGLAFNRKAYRAVADALRDVQPRARSG